MTYDELEMIEDFQDWAIETEENPGSQRILSKELIEFYVNAFIQDMNRKQMINTMPTSGKESTSINYELNWALFVEYTRGLSDNSAPFEYVDLKTLQGQKLKQHVQRQYQESFL